MIEYLITHEGGRFSRCRTCGHEPRHIRATGRSSKEPVQFIKTACRHRLECRCGARTALRDSLNHAESEWGTDYAQLTLTLRPSRRKRVAA
ncbi:MAG: hypothetical protein WA777_02815 [Rhodanobacter sp.]